MGIFSCSQLCPPGGPCRVFPPDTIDYKDPNNNDVGGAAGLPAAPFTTVISATRMSRNWSSATAAPGSVRPVYGARYPPLHQSQPPAKNELQRDGGDQFLQYDDRVSDAWSPTVKLDDAAVEESAARVLAAHQAAISALPTRERLIMPLVTPLPAKNNRQQALQRLATQKAGPMAFSPAPSSSVVQQTAGGGGGLYPRLPETCSDTASHLRAASVSSAQTAQAGGAGGSVLPTTAIDRDSARFERLKRMLGCSAADAHLQGTAHSPPPDVDVDALRKDCWMGIPHRLRPHAWRVLSGYVPTCASRREETLARKREEYWTAVEQYYHTRHDGQHQETFRQIHIDIPRMCPLIPLFQQKIVQEMFERILYIWSIRHPASGYVQGINDLVTPFFVVFLSEFVPAEVEVGTFDVMQLPVQQQQLIEADSFWCVSALLDSIQDNYTFAQPGIQRKVLQLRHLMSRVDRALHAHLESVGVEYLQFSFRWFNNLLMREIPLRATIRLWDTYLSERNGFAQYHVYVCAAFLRAWSRQLQLEKDFQGVMLLLQALPTQAWGDREICELTADAYSLMAVFDGAKRHLTVG